MNTIAHAFELMENNQPEKAIETLRECEPKANDDEKFTIAQMYIQLGFLIEAQTILLQLHRKYPNEGALKITLAEIYIELEQDEQAIDLLVQIKEDDDVYLEGLIQLADLYQAQGLFEVAEQKLLEAKLKEPNEKIIDFALGELYFSFGDFKKAILHYEKVIMKKEKVGTVSIHQRLAESNAAIGEYELALDYFKKIQDEMDPDDLFRYGITAYQADRGDIAIKAWEKVLELDPYYSTVYYQLAKAYEQEGRIEEAFTTAKKGLHYDEFNKELYFLTGILANQLNKHEESEKYLQEAVALDPDYKDAILALIDHLKNKEEHEGIIELLKEVKALGADDALYDWELARAYNEIEEYNESLKHYNQAYNGLNEDSDFMKEYGYFLTEEGEVARAIPVFEAYLKLVPSDGVVEDFLHRLIHTTEDF